MLGAYERGLQFVMARQTLTLVVFLGTLALTLILYVTIPKGLFPVQDVGVIQAISVADNSVSYTAMVERQMALAEAILKDPDVTGLTSYVGIDGTNTTLNNGRFLINLKARDDRSRQRPRLSPGACRAKSRMFPASSCICSPNRT